MTKRLVGAVDPAVRGRRRGDDRPERGLPIAGPRPEACRTRRDVTVLRVGAAAERSGSAIADHRMCAARRAAPLSGTSAVTS
jgi:hypothetical protein